MSTPIRNYKDEDRPAVIQRRLKSKTKGLGHLSAVKASKKTSSKKG